MAQYFRSMTATWSKSAARTVTGIAIIFAVALLSPAAWSAATDGPLPVDEAFPITASFVAGKLALQIGVTPGHYLYRDRFEFRVDGKDVGPAVSAKLTKLAQEKGKVKNDPTFGKTTVFEKPFVLELIPVATTKAELELVFQGCSEVAGICYPPSKRVFTLTSGVKNLPPKELQPTSLKNLFKPQVSR